MLTTIMMFMPDRMLGLLIVGICVAMLLGLSPRKGIGMIASIVIFTLCAPLIESILSELPFWVTLLVFFIVGMQIVREVLGFVFGSEAAGHIIGGAVLACVRTVASIVGVLFRLVCRGVAKLAARATLSRKWQWHTD